MKRIIAYFLFMCMLFSSAYAQSDLDGFVFSDEISKPTYSIDGLDGFVFEGEKPAEKPAEVVEIVPDNSVEIDVAYKAKFNLLKTIGLIDEKDGTNIASIYTRKQFAKLAVQLFNLVPIDGEIFSDVPKDDPYAPYINAVCMGGIMNGATKSKFNPNYAITYEQILKILIKAIGYEDMANAKGGYPTGYILVANDLKLNKNIDFKNGKNSNLGMVLNLVYNALNTETFEVYEISNDVNYKKSGKTLLEQLYNIQKISGIFNEYYGSNIYGVSNCFKDEICIDRVPFKFENADISLIGNKVTAFVEVDNLGKKIITLEKDEKNNEITVNSNDITNITKDFFEYGENKVKLSDNAIVVYNGVYLSGYAQCELDKLNINSGDFKFVDYDNDKKYDVLFVWAYNYFVVDSVSTDSQKLYLKNQQKLNGLGYIDCDMEDSRILTKIICENEVIDLSQIRNNSVISVAQSLNEVGKKVNSIFLSTNSVSGVITELKRPKDTAIIDGKSYPLAYGYESANIEELKVSLNAKFLLTHRNEIFGIDTSNILKELNYAYLTATNLKSEMSSILKLQLFSTNGKWEELQCDDRTTVFKTIALNEVEEKNYTTSDYSTLKKVLDDQIGKSGALISYKLKEDKIKEIYLTEDLSKTNRYPGLDKKNFSLDYSVEGDNNNIRLLDGTLGAKMFADGKTKVFIVPDDLSNSVTKKMYKVGSIQLFETPNDVYLKNLKIYDVGADRIAGIMVQQLSKVGADRVNLESSAMIVQNVVQAVNKDGENTYKINGMKDGKVTSIFASPEYGDVSSTITNDKWYRENMSVSTLKAGDVIQYEADGIGEIVNFRVLFRAEDLFNEKWDKNTVITSDNKMAMLHTAYGVVTEKNDYCLIVNCIDPQNPSYEKAYRLSNTQVYSVKTENSTLKKIKPNAIAVGDKVFMRSWWNVTKEVLVIQ